LKNFNDIARQISCIENGFEGGYSFSNVPPADWRKYPKAAVAPSLVLLRLSSIVSSGSVASGCRSRMFASP